MAAALFFASVSAVQADDNNLTDEVRLLREQNALLQKQVSSQGGALDALTKKVGQLESAQAARETAAGENAPAARSGFNLGKVNLGAEGAVAFFHTGKEGFAPNAEFRVDEARIFLDAPVANNVYFFTDIQLAAREEHSLYTQLGELYLDFQDVSQLWGKDGQLNVRAGRMFIPFGEEYQNRYAMENPLISRSLADFWGIDPGVELYGTLGKFSYVAAVQNGGDNGVRDFDADKSVTARVGFTPNKHWHFSVSALRTGDLDAANDYFSALWFASGWFKSTGSPATTKFHVDLAQADLTARWDSGHVSASGGVAHYGDNDTAQNNARDIYYWSVEAQQDLSKKFFVAARFSQIFAEHGYPLTGYGTFDNYLFANPATELSRLSLGAGWRLSDRLILKAEYSLERGQGAGGARNNEDFFGTEAAFKF